MSKIKASFGRLVTMLTDVKKYWHNPREGDYVPYKEYTSYCLGLSGSMLAGNVMSYFNFAASCLLVGAIYEISFRDIYVLGLIGMPIGLALSPVHMMLTDNLGVLRKETMKKMNVLFITMGIIGLALYFVPQAPFESFLPALPQVLGTILLINCLAFYYKVIVYQKLSPKYGKYRPWIITGGIPTFYHMFCRLLPFNSMLIHQVLVLPSAFFRLQQCKQFCRSGKQHYQCNLPQQRRAHTPDVHRYDYRLGSPLRFECGSPRSCHHDRRI